MWEADDEQINLNDFTLVCNVKQKKKLLKKWPFSSLLLFNPNLANDTRLKLKRKTVWYDLPSLVTHQLKSLHLIILFFIEVPCKY